ncbi:DoxX family protein [Halobacillus sp. Marseille-P3879]|uniref:DoxX family protein n=1 Tax=Halobacillus TaxID=45667 RepID=UPI000C7B87E2|nr:DoxX family protein [Halobacillus sp. Marseille-P3879]
MERSFEILKFLKYTVAFVFITSGLMKVVNSELADYFTSLALPYPVETMYTVAWVEITAGLLLIFNKYMKPALIALMVIMVGALLLTKVPALHAGFVHALFSARLDIVMLVLLVVLYRNRLLSS